MDKTFTNEDVARLFEKAASELSWISKSDCIPFPNDVIVAFVTDRTGILMNIIVKRELPGHFSIKHYYGEVVDATFSTEEDIKAFFEKEILPVLKYEYYKDISSTLIDNIAEVLEKSGKKIYHVKQVAKVGDRVTLQSLTFGNNAITFSYAKNGDIQVFEYRLNYDVVIYDADELSQNLDAIEEKLMSLARELVESFVEVED